MHLSKSGLDLVKQFEGLRLEAYLDTGGIPTIGYGTVRYPPWHPIRPNGRVMMGDVCTEEQAELYFKHDLLRTEQAVDSLTIDNIVPRQFDALTSLVYNIGEGAYRTSTLRKLVNADPDNPAIRGQFLRWVYDDGRRIKGLVNRREKEANHYFGVTA